MESAFLVAGMARSVPARGEFGYKYTDNARAKACLEEAQSAEVRSQRLACPLCNAEHPEHEHAIRRASAHLN